MVLFFEKGAPTQQIWYYQLDPGRSMGKTNPLNDADLAEFVALSQTRAASPKSWCIDVAGIDQKTYDLATKNPAGATEVVHRRPADILADIAALDAQSAAALAQIRTLIG